MSEKVIFFVPYHTGYAHAELIQAFSSFTDVHLFIYKWNPACQRVREHFSSNQRVHLTDFTIENILQRIRENPQRKIVVLLTASTNYLFGQLQVRLFRLIEENFRQLIDVYPVGHCMYGCQSCTYAYTHRIPLTFTNFLQRSNEKLSLKTDFEILFCPSYSFEGAPFSYLSNIEIIEYLSQLNCSHAIKLHPLAYESLNNDEHPFLSLTELEKRNVRILFDRSTSILPADFATTLKLIEHARVVICDSNSSIPFETLYFRDKKFIFVYETIEDFDENDDRQNYFHKFQNVQQLKVLIEKYFQENLQTKTSNSHEFFLEKYDEPTGDEIQRLAEIREWTSNENDDDEEKEIVQDENICQTIKEEFQSMMSSMALYALGDFTMEEVVQMFFSEENRIFDTICSKPMASSSENDENSSSDDEAEADVVFYDANSDWSDHELKKSHRWNSLSETNLSIATNNFDLQLTENQQNDLARRTKLQRLREREEEAAISPLDLISTSSFRTQSFLHSTHLENERVGSEESFSTPDLLKDHIDGEHVRRTEQNLQNSVLSSRDSPMLINSTSKMNPFQQQRSLPYPTLPSASSSSSNRGSNGIYSKITNLSAISEPNIVDMTLTQFNELSANNRYRATGDELFSPFLTHRFDQSKYIESIDANPMTQTILERANGSTTLMSQRQNSILNKTHQLRRNSSDHDNLNGSLNFETTISRQRSQLKSGNDDDDNDDDDDEEEEDEDEDDDDNESSSSESSSTKSSHTTTNSSPSNIAKSSKAAVRAASMLIRGGKRQLSRLMTRSFLRRNGRKFVNGHPPPVFVDEEEDDGEKLLLNDGFNGDLKYKASRILKEQLQFDKTQLLQTIVNAHRGPIWCMKFSPDGHLLATGGQDNLLKVWVLKSAQPYFQDFSRITSNLSKQQNEVLSERFNAFHQSMSSETLISTINTKLGLHEIHAPFYSKPFCEFNGHQAPVLDVAWSKSLFLLSSSMDKTVRLWHLSRRECLCFFRHVDFVSAIAFHPRDDRYFISASLDGHVRLWNIPDKRVVYWTLIPAQASSLITAAQANLITAVHFCDEGRKVTVGTFDGRFLLYNDLLQYDTVMNIGDKDGSRSHRSRKRCRKPYKITGIETMNSNHCRVLITSNDSRIRLYDIRTKEIERKYRGYSNQSSQIRASFSHDDLYIISGSEDGWFYIWRVDPNNSMNNDNTNSSNTTATRKQRRHFGRAFERIRVHNTMVTSAIFAPHPQAIMEFLYSSTSSSCSNENSNHLFPNRSNTNLPNLVRSVPSTITPITANHNRTRLICVHGAPSPTELSTTTNVQSNPYVMITADSKGQLKLLVNRLYR